MPQFIALLRKDSNSDFGVDFPDFPGCVSAGSTLDEARKMAEEALQFHVEGMHEDGESLPSPSRLEDVMADPENQDTVAFLVEAPDKPVRSVRVNITLPQKALQKIDEYASAHGLSRSSFLTQAAMATITRHG